MLQKLQMHKWLGAAIIAVAVVLFAMPAKAQKTAEENFAVCKACHSIGGGKLVGPDLKDVTKRRDRKWLVSFIKSSQTMVKAGDKDAVAIFEEYNKIPMPDQALTDDEINAVLDYIEKYDPAAATASTEQTPATTPTTDAKHGGSFLDNHHTTLPYSYNVPFILCVVVMLAALIDLTVTKFLKLRFIHVTLLLTGVYFMGHILYREAQFLGRQQGYEPDQPIAFSHKVHAGDNKIDCKYCHFGAVAGSKHSGIPSANVCLNCHNNIRKGANTGETEIAKIHEAIKTGKPIQWVKVHNLPDHVYFSHAQHVTVGKLDCKECHGDVASMGRVYQENDLSMGWCINCHRKSNVQFDKNGYYASSFTKLHDDLKAGKIDKVTPEQIGANECQKCHY